jgi:hypothetical protein
MPIVLALLLLVATGPAWAQWVKENDAENPIHYIDSSSITKIGEMRRVWVTQFLREEGVDAEMSRRALLEFDCSGRRFRYLSIAKHFAPEVGVHASSPKGDNSQKSDYVPTPIDYQKVHRIICAP